MLIYDDIISDRYATEVDTENIKDEYSYKVLNEVDIPSYSGFKSYMGYKSFNTSSNQYRLQQEATTDTETGLRMINDRYIVAVGSGVGTYIGQYFDLVLENGTVIPCVMGDQKADCHTDGSNLITVHSNCCSEFIVDTSMLNETAKQMGDISYIYNEWQSPVDTIIVYDMDYETDAEMKENEELNEEEDDNNNGSQSAVYYVHSTTNNINTI